MREMGSMDAVKFNFSLFLNYEYITALCSLKYTQRRSAKINGQPKVVTQRYQGCRKGF